MSLPTDDKARKALPIFTGFLMYFPDVPAAVANSCWDKPAARRNSVKRAGNVGIRSRVSVRAIGYPLVVWRYQ